MYTAVKGTYENGVLTLEEIPPTAEKTEVVVLFMNEEGPRASGKEAKGVRIGSLAHQGYKLPDDFNAPLDDLKDYI
ncbi:MAG: hypothetical protein ACO1N1_24975 [Dyadobacter fermentans]